MTSIDDLLGELSPERRLRVEQQSKVLEEQIRSLQTLRDALERTQAAIAEHQTAMSDADLGNENRGDLLLSALSHFVNTAGGKLSIVIEYPGKRPLALSDIRKIEDHPDGHAADFAMTTLRANWLESSEHEPSTAGGKSRSAA